MTAAKGACSRHFECQKGNKEQQSENARQPCARYDFPDPGKNQQCANWVHCARRVSGKFTFVDIFWEVLFFSGSLVLREFHYWTL